MDCYKLKFLNAGQKVIGKYRLNLETYTFSVYWFQCQGIHFNFRGLEQSVLIIDDLETLKHFDNFVITLYMAQVKGKLTAFLTCKDNFLPFKK